MSNITQLGNSWKFTSEADLEEFILSKLEELLNLKVICQQFYIEGRYCDLLAIDARGQLHVLELKNSFDSGLVSQLTRYYILLNKEQPSLEGVNYNFPIILVAIAPDFLESNIGEVECSKLAFQLFRYETTYLDSSPYFKLYRYFDDTQVAARFVSVKLSQDNEVAPPPRALVNLLERCSDRDREALLQMRKQILSYPLSIKESYSNGAITYTKGKNNCIAEINFDVNRQKVFVCLFLPFPKKKGRNKKRVSYPLTCDMAIYRIKIWFYGQDVTDVGFFPNGTKKLITLKEWLSFERDLSSQALNLWRGYGPLKWKGNDSILQNVETRKMLVQKHFNFNLLVNGLAMTIDRYCQFLKKCNLVEEDPNVYRSLEKLTELALREFLKRARL